MWNTDEPNANEPLRKRPFAKCAEGQNQLGAAMKPKRSVFPLRP